VLNRVTQKIKAQLFTPKQQQAFLEDIATLVEDGIPAKQAVEVLNKLAAGLTAEVADNVLTKLSEGKYLADGLVGWFPVSVIEIVRAGEEGGTLAKTLQAAAAALAQKNTAITSLLSSLTYPLVVLSLGLGVSVFIKESVFDSFTAIKPVDLWPGNAQAALALGSFVQYRWFVMLALLIGFFVGLSFFLRYYIGVGRQFVDTLPVLSLYRQVIAARFMETLGLLISNGVVLKKALKIMQYNANPYLSAHLMTMEYRLGGGKENIAEVLDTGLINPEDLMRLRVIARGKGFEYALLRQGRRANERSLDNIRTTGRLLGGTLLGAAALLAAFLITSIYAVGAILGT